jgi:Mce-associated membrane protein
MTGRSTAWRAAVVVSAVLAVLGLAAAGWFGYSWLRGGGGTAETVSARDDALSAARELAATLQTVDPAHPDESMKTWQSAATGALLTKLNSEQAKYLEQLKKAPTTSEATVVDAALTQLDASAGTATVIAALDVRQSTVVNGRPGPQKTRQLRIKLTMNRTDAGWKVASSGLVNA